MWFFTQESPLFSLRVTLLLVVTLCVLGLLHFWPKSQPEGWFFTLPLSQREEEQLLSLWD